jgi:hypothetical protein
MGLLIGTKLSVFEQKWTGDCKVSTEGLAGRYRGAVGILGSSSGYNYV